MALVQVVISGEVAHVAAIEEMDINFEAADSDILAGVEQHFGMTPGTLGSHMVVPVQSTGNIIIKHQDVFGAPKVSANRTGRLCG